jgi:erythromycin esterase-like protein
LEWGWIGRRSRRELLEWARSWNLRNPTDRIRIVGVDPQDNGLARGAMGPMLERAYGESARETWGRTAGELAKADEQTQVFGDSGIGPSTSALLQTLAARLEADAPLLKSRLGRPDYDKLLSYARELAAFADFNSGGAWPSRSRDWYMALGILRALEEGGSNAKAVFWGHNSHVSATARSWGPTGAVLRGALGCGYRSVATTFGEGSFLAQIPNDPADRLQVTTVPAAAEDSIEAALAKIQPGAHIISWECGANSDGGPDWLKEPHMMRWVGGLYAPGTALSGSYRQYELTDAFDAVVYFPVVQAEADPGDRPLIPPRKR